MIVFPIIFYSQQGYVTLLFKKFETENIGDFSVWDDSPMIRLDDFGNNFISFGDSYYRQPFFNQTIQIGEDVFCEIVKVEGNKIYALILVPYVLSDIAQGNINTIGFLNFYLNQKFSYNLAALSMQNVRGNIYNSLYRASPAHNRVNKSIHLNGIQRYYNQLFLKNSLSSENINIDAIKRYHIKHLEFLNLSNTNIKQEGMYDTSRLNFNETLNSSINIGDGLYDTSRFYNDNFGNIYLDKVEGDFKGAIRFQNKHNSVSEAIVNAIGLYYFSLDQRAAHNRSNNSISLIGHGPEQSAIIAILNTHNIDELIKIEGEFSPPTHTLQVDNIKKHLNLHGAYSQNKHLFKDFVFKKIILQGINLYARQVKYADKAFKDIQIFGNKYIQGDAHLIHNRSSSSVSCSGITGITLFKKNEEINQSVSVSGIKRNIASRSYSKEITKTSITIFGLTNRDKKLHKSNDTGFAYIQMDGSYFPSEVTFSDNINFRGSIRFKQQLFKTFINTTTPYKISWTPPTRKERYKTFRYFAL